MEATIRLFKAVPVTDPSRLAYQIDTFEVHRKTLPKGFVFAPEVLAGAMDDLDVLIKKVDAECGLDPNKLNKAFHKSFGKVQSAPMEQLFIEQMAHYLTTYGAERFGIYDVDRVFIPVEALDVPKIDIETFDFVVIRGLTIAELKTELQNLLFSGVALSEQSVKDALEIAAVVGFSVDDIGDVRNREVKIGLYDLTGMVPADPVEFLRYVVYKTTGDTLLIKNGKSIAAIKAGVAEFNLTGLFESYDKHAGLDRLGEIFLRFKPLFLALRADKRLRPTINKIRRAAERTHKPMPQDYLNSVTAIIKHADPYEAGTKNSLDYNRLRSELSNPNVTVFRKVRLAQALATRANPDLDSIVYKVRNGKSFATAFESHSPESITQATRAYGTVMASIGDDLVPFLLDKKVYIPDGVVYGLPSSEKQFTGNLPAGTYVEVKPTDALVAGVYWEDQGSHRIDLDLSISNLDGKVGWDGRYRNAPGTVLFSGDNTSAPFGASEVFYFDPSLNGSWMMDINYFNFYASVPVPFKIVVGTADAKDITSNFVFDPNRLLASASSVLDVKQKNLGTIVADSKGSHRFYFSSTEMGGGRSSRYNIHAERARKFAMASMLNAPTLNDLLRYTGVQFVESADEADINLSPQAIDKTTILSLLSP